jgi:hypothetical protein
VLLPEEASWAGAPGASANELVATVMPPATTSVQTRNEIDRKNFTKTSTWSEFTYVRSDGLETGHVTEDLSGFVETAAYTIRNRPLFQGAF